jgi:catechol 2,3-dioxygenase-like lactoylglutathione lyase family enzyme
MVTGIEHIAIFSEDTARLKNWYQEKFDWQQVYDNGKGTFFLKAQDGVMIEFVTAEGRGADSGVKLSGIRHLAISVSDFDGMVARLAECEVVSPPAESKGVRTFFFRDIDGNILHLIQRQQPL